MTMIEMTIISTRLNIERISKQDGVISCHAPPHTPGKVTICITSGNREACSEVREFEYRDKPHVHMHNTLTDSEISRSSEELRLLVRFVQTLLSDKISQKGSEHSWTQIIEALSDDSLTSSRTTDWLLEELLKDKLETWLSSKLQDNNTFPALSNGEQGIIHMVFGLGFVWALTPILKSGVGINFRDANGWTALHWASHFGRQKMVAELVASGAYLGAVTNPSQQDSTGKRRTLNSISNQNLVVKDHLSLKDAITAVRNAAYAASRMQAAFRAHSFKKRKQKVATERDGTDEYDILPSEIEALLAVSKAVGKVEKIILRWHGKRVGLRGFHLDSIDESADEDITKVKQGGWENEGGTTSQLDAAA
ncbi:ankyrin repeat-containing protein, partial [Tanacetum coccineum]